MTPAARRKPQAVPDPAVPRQAGAGASQEEIRRRNLGAVLRHVHVHGPTSRAELGSRLGLNRSTIGALAADLAAAGLVTEKTAATAGRAGRPSRVVSVRSDRVYAYGLSIEVDRLRAGRIPLGGGMLDVREVDRPYGMPASEAVSTLAALVRDMERRAAVDALLVGGAVAVADTMRQRDGTIRVGGADPYLEAALAREFAGTPGFVSGDLADFAGVAEHVRGVATDVDDLVYLHGDLGVSAGILIGGRLLVGHQGQAGKVGHMVVNRGGVTCDCGTRGCWQTEISATALLRLAGRTGEEPRAAVRAVLSEAAHGDRSAQHAVQHVAGWLGVGVANLVNLLGPAAVVFGGSLGEVYAAATDTVRRCLNETLPTSGEPVTLRTAALGRDAALIGAAELAFGQLLADPLNSAAPGGPDRDERPTNSPFSSAPRESRS